ncbi:MAG: hypothetical protein QXE94_00295 [Candidatus Bathyarchaeia archaeon]
MVKSVELKEGVQFWIKKLMEDPIVKILAKNSHLTKIQLETLLINILAENISGKPLKYEEKAKLRLTKAKISRGAFNRTLKQAEKNVIKSIYTIILLGYLGIFETTVLDPYIEVANKLQEYIDTHRIGTLTDENQLSHLNFLREEIENRLKQLANSFGEEE